MINIMQIVRRYTGNYPLFNEMMNLNKEKFKTVVCYLEGSRDGRNEIEDLVDCVYYLDLKRKSRLFGNLVTSKRLSDLIKEHDIHIVNCQLEKTMPVGVLAAKISLRKPSIVTTIHGLVGGDDNRIAKKISNLFYYRFLNGIICVSHSIKEDVIRANFPFDYSKIFSVQNGLSYDVFLTLSSRAETRAQVLPGYGKMFLFGTIGRLAEKKNHKNLLLAMSIVVKNRQDCALIIAGSGPLEDKLKAQAVSLHLQRHVFFLGKRSDVPEILRSLDAFLFPTYREGLPLALLEAMASGLPVIASNIPVVKEVFGHTEMGYLVDPDSPTEIARAMLDLMSVSEQQLQQMGMNARHRALSDFSAVKMVRGYENIFEKLNYPSR